MRDQLIVSGITLHLLGTHCGPRKLITHLCVSGQSMSPQSSVRIQAISQVYRFTVRGSSKAHVLRSDYTKWQKASYFMIFLCCTLNFLRQENKLRDFTMTGGNVSDGHTILKMCGSSTSYIPVDQMILYCGEKE